MSNNTTIKVEVSPYETNLPPNQVWKKNACPVERLEALNEVILKVERDVFDAIRKSESSPQEIEKISQEMRELEDALQKTRPYFPSYTYNDADCEYIGEYEIRSGWDGIVSRMRRLNKRVIKSLYTPGTSFEEKEGKDTVDEKVNEDFSQIRENLGYLISKANKIRTYGLIEYCEWDYGWSSEDAVIPHT